MNRKLFCLAVGLVVLSGLASSAGSDYSHNEKLYFGESIEINDYVIEYKSGSSGGQMFRIGRWTGTSFQILEEFEDSEIYESEGETIQVSDNMSLTLEKTGYDKQDRFIEISVSASKDVFSSGDLSSSAPSKIIVSRGDSEEIPLTLKNTGYLNQSYDLSARTNSSLKTSFSFQDFNVTEVYVAAGKKETVDAIIEVPQTARIGTHDLELVAENFTRLTESIRVEVKGAEKDRELELDVEQIYKEIRPGKSAEFYVSIRNRGEAKLEDINITATPPDGWEYSMDGGFVPELRDRYGRERAKITVEAPQDADAGDYMMEVSANSKETSIEEPKEVRLHVRKKSGLAYIGAGLMAVSLLVLVIVYRKFQRR